MITDDCEPRIAVTIHCNSNTCALTSLVLAEMNHVWGGHCGAIKLGGLIVDI